MKLLNVKKLCAGLLSAAMISSVFLSIPTSAGEVYITKYCQSGFNRNWEKSQDVHFDDGNNGKFVWGYLDDYWGLDVDYASVRCTGYMTYRSELLNENGYWDNWERLDNEWCYTSTQHVGHYAMYRAHFFTPAKLK